MSTKKIVISKQYSLLSPYWFIEYLKLKGYKDIYVYKRKTDKDYKIIGYELETNIKNLKSFEKIFHYKFTSIDLGKIISIENFESKVKNNDFVISYFDNIQDREDIDLINIAKKINNKGKVKIVEIPKDVCYNIKEYECAIGEYIEEKHRIWD